MKPRVRAITLLLCACLLTATAVRAGGETLELAVEATWQGEFPVSAIAQLPEGQRETAVGLITEATTFAAVWARLQPQVPVPEIDFGSRLVLFVRNVQFFNPTRIGSVTLTDGIASVLAMEGRSARPIAENVMLALAVVPAAGVRAVDTGAGTFWLPER